MFEKIFKGWNTYSLIKAAIQDSSDMLKMAENLFNSVTEAFIHGKEIDYDIYSADKKINKKEIAIRRKVLQHLSINPKQDIVASLVLTTIIIDIERIGDYSKNIFELYQTYRKFDIKPVYVDRCEQITNCVWEMFEMTVQALEEEKSSSAQQVMDAHRKINSNCEELMADLAKDDELKARQAITFVLYARYIKRVSAHLTNIVSSVLNPFDRIGYYPPEEVE